MIHRADFKLSLAVCLSLLSVCLIARLCFCLSLFICRRVSSLCLWPGVFPRGWQDVEIHQHYQLSLSPSTPPPLSLSLSLSLSPVREILPFSNLNIYGGGVCVRVCVFIGGGGWGVDVKVCLHLRVCGIVKAVGETRINKSHALAAASNMALKKKK